MATSFNTDKCKVMNLRKNHLNHAYSLLTAGLTLEAQGRDIEVTARSLKILAHCALWWPTPSKCWSSVLINTWGLHFGEEDVSPPVIVTPRQQLRWKNCYSPDPVLLEWGHSLKQVRHLLKSGEKIFKVSNWEHLDFAVPGGSESSHCQQRHRPMNAGSSTSVRTDSFVQTQNVSFPTFCRSLIQEGLSLKSAGMCLSRSSKEAILPPGSECASPESLRENGMRENVCRDYRLRVIWAPWSLARHLERKVKLQSLPVSLGR